MKADPRAPSRESWVATGINAEMIMIYESVFIKTNVLLYNISKRWGIGVKKILYYLFSYSRGKHIKNVKA